jgi:hypothetical protein
MESVKSRKQAIYLDFFQFPVLEKKPRIKYNSRAVDSFQDSSNRHVRQAKVTRDSAPRQELRGQRLGET